MVWDVFLPWLHMEVKASRVGHLSKGLTHWDSYYACYGGWSEDGGQSKGSTWFKWVLTHLTQVSQVD